MNGSPILVMEGVSKSFPGVRALSQVNFLLRKGEIHALLGENGAGKSTLIKVLTGVYEKDEGTIILNKEEIKLKTPQEAQRLGISTVYQEVNLCPNLSVAENLFIGRQPKRRGSIDWPEMERRAQKLMQRLGIDILVKQPLSAFSVAIQQMVAIARAVDMSSGVLILDEPTSSLDQKEVAQLFQVMKRLKEEGMAILFVTHFLDQVYEVSDRITVLRNGKLVGEFATEELPRVKLVEKMVGKEMSELESYYKERSLASSEEVLLQVNGVGKRGTIAPFHLEFKKGEVLGLAGLLGSGRTEAAKLLFGIEKADAGTIVVNQQMLAAMYPKKAIEHGLAFCPEERKVEGIAGELSVRENIMLALQAKRGFFSYISLKQQQAIAQKYIDLLKIKTPSMEQRIDQLSGGNQQKVILARWLATNPKLLILDEPLRGIDIGSKAEIRGLILQLAQDGMTILLITSEWEEMIGCCDRIMVLRDREIIKELTGTEINEKTILETIAEGGAKDEHSQAILA